MRIHACRAAASPPHPGSPECDQQHQGDSPAERPYLPNPSFPALAVSVPLAYSLALRACLHPEPLERPTFAQLSKILSEVVSEVAGGVYVNSKGLLQVCASRTPALSAIV